MRFFLPDGVLLLLLLLLLDRCMESLAVLLFTTTGLLASQPWLASLLDCRRSWHTQRKKVETPRKPQKPDLFIQIIIPPW